MNNYVFDQAPLAPELQAPELQAPELHPEDLFEIHAVGLTTRKRRGETAEAVFLAIPCPLFV